MNEMDEDGKRQNEMLPAAPMRLKRTAFVSGSGEVDFEEFYDWWTSDKESSVLKKAQDGNQKDYEIEPY